MSNPLAVNLTTPSLENHVARRLQKRKNAAFAPSGSRTTVTVLKPIYPVCGTEKDLIISDNRPVMLWNVDQIIGDMGRRKLSEASKHLWLDDPCTRVWQCKESAAEPRGVWQPMYTVEVS